MDSSCESNVQRAACPLLLLSQSELAAPLYGFVSSRDSSEFHGGTLRMFHHHLGEACRLRWGEPIRWSADAQRRCHAALIKKGRPARYGDGSCESFF